MRITNSMMVSTMMRNLNNNLNRMDKIQMQMATGKRIHKPSDDPVGMSKVLTLTSDIATSEQYKKNVDEALGWLETTEIAVTQLKDVVHRVKELTVRAANGTFSPADKEATQKEITQLKEQIISIGNTNYAGRYVFGGYNTMVNPFTIEKDPIIGDKLKYNGKYISPGGIVDGAIPDNDFINFLVSESSKELTKSQMTDPMKIEIGMGDIVSVNTSGHELFQQGFGGVFETLTKLEKQLGGDSDYKHGFVDMKSKVEIDATIPIDVDNSLGNTIFKIQMKDDIYDIKLPQKNPLTLDDLKNAVDSIEYLRKNGLSFDYDAGKLVVTADEKFTILDTNLSTSTFPISANNALAPMIVGDRMSGQMTVGAPPNNEMTLTIGGVATTISLVPGTTYDARTAQGKTQLLRDITAQIPQTVPSLTKDARVIFTEDNRLQFVGKNGTADNDLEITGPLATLLGVTLPAVSAYAVIKSEDLDMDSLTVYMDKNMDNLLAKISEIGAKVNRLELDQNRIDDNIINYNKLLSKTEDADMAEVIMKFKIEENIYRSSLSTGAKIIQPTLIDFLR